jgi:hypothetical protein
LVRIGAPFTGDELTNVNHGQQRFPERIHFRRIGGVEQTSGGICDSRAGVFSG